MGEKLCCAFTIRMWKVYFTLQKLFTKTIQDNKKCTYIFLDGGIKLSFSWTKKHVICGTSFSFCLDKVVEWQTTSSYYVSLLAHHRPFHFNATKMSVNDNGGLDEPMRQNGTNYTNNSSTFWGWPICMVVCNLMRVSPLENLCVNYNHSWQMIRLFTLMALQGCTFHRIKLWFSRMVMTVFPVNLSQATINTQRAQHYHRIDNDVMRFRFRFNEYTFMIVFHVTNNSPIFGDIKLGHFGWQNVKHFLCGLWLEEHKHNQNKFIY